MVTGEGKSKSLDLALEEYMCGSNYLPWSEKLDLIKREGPLEMGPVGLSRGVDADIYPVIIGINRLPFAYTSGQSCSGSQWDHRGISKDYLSVGRISSTRDRNGEFTDNDEKQGHFFVRVDSQYPGFASFMDDLKSVDLECNELAEGSYQDKLGKSFRFYHKHDGSKNMTPYWLTVAAKINEHVPLFHIDYLKLSQR